ncbi:hypothetical protein CR513_55643, partial [Mucuna pruriens]
MEYCDNGEDLLEEASSRWPAKQARLCCLGASVPSIFTFSMTKRGGSHSSGSSNSSNPNGSFARGSETQHSPTQATEKEFPFSVTFREAGEVPTARIPSWMDRGVVTTHSSFTRLDKLVGMADAIYRQGPWSVNILPCWTRKCMCEGTAKGEEHYFYFYETFFSKLGITLPFTPFEQAVLCALNIAPTQLNPNS